ncbi:unnamed protein product [Prorocentrum cordatum]|uniref:Glutathione transferase n=1 Tax=Prorocentrum cordatum TaxID=2364126 RepID=A0ABN9SPW3_9DINO|nr:unnamed protein product [Polarella glacialis]
MVPTNLVPAVKLKGSGDVVWESEAILRRLDDEFPDTRPMFADEGKVLLAGNITQRLVNTSFGLAYRSTENMTDDEIAEARSGLVAAVDALDQHLAAGGPFLAGDQVTAADAMAVPMLERYGVQMPFFAAQLSIRDPARWPSLARWFDAMEALPSYGGRVAGDAYSWTPDRGRPGAHAHLRRQERHPRGRRRRARRGGRAGRRRAAGAGPGLQRRGPGRGARGGARGGCGEAAGQPRGRGRGRRAGRAEEPEGSLKRLAPEKAPAVDAALRAVAAALLAGAPPVLPRAAADGAEVDRADVAQACHYVAARLCVPRDMGAPAAAALRAALLSLAAAAEGGTAA